MVARTRSRCAARRIVGSLALLMVLTSAPCFGEPPALSELSFLPGDNTPAPAIGRQSDPKIVAGDNQYLVVWVDDRTAITEIANPFSAAPYDHHAATKWDIYATRLDASGNLIDQTPIMVTREVLMQVMPDVAWNGENWLVTWAGAGGTYECCPTYSIFAARVSPAGQVLDDPPIVVDVATTVNDLLWPAAGSDGNNFVVVWRDLDGGIWTLDATRIAPDGTVLDPGGVYVRHDTSNSYPVDPDIVWATDEYLLIWEEGSGGVKGQRLAADLQKIGPVFEINANSWTGYNPSVATDGTDFFVAWSSRWPGQVSQLDGARVSHAGVVLDPSPILLTDITDNTTYEPDVAWDGSNYVVAFNRRPSPDDDLFAIRVTTGGVVLDFDASAISISNHGEAELAPDIAAAPGGAGALIVWHDFRYRPSFFTPSMGDIFGVAFAPDGTVGSEFCVALGAPRQTLLHLVPNGSGYLAVYRSETSPETRILAQRLDATGLPIDPEPAVVATGGNELTNPSAAWNGSIYLVVWEDKLDNQTYARRVGADLSLIDPAPVSLMPGNWPDVAAIGDVFATFTSWEEPHEARGIVGVRMQGSDGAILDATPQGILSGGYSVLPRVSVLGDRWLVVRQVHPTHDDPSSTAKASFVDVNLVATAPFMVDLDARNPSVAGGPDQALLVVDGRNSNIGREIYGRRILADGTFLDPLRGIEISTAVEDQFEPTVAWDGNEYVTLFTDFRNAITDASPPGDIYGARVTDAGGVMDPTGFPIFADAIPERFQAVAGQAGGFIAGGAVFRPETGYANYRVGLAAASGATTTALEAELVSERQPLLGVSNNFGRGAVSLDLHVDVAQSVSVAVYDVSGRKLRDLFEGNAAAGALELVWDGRNDRGVSVSRGVYFVRARTGATDAVARIIRY